MSITLEDFVGDAPKKSQTILEQHQKSISGTHS